MHAFEPIWKYLNVQENKNTKKVKLAAENITSSPGFPLAAHVIL